MVKPRKWARNSVQDYFNKSTAKSFRSSLFLKLNQNERNSKHTFFPGNEIFGSRLNSKVRFVFNSDSVGKAFWDVFILLITVYVSYQIPYSISFCSDIDPMFWNFLASVYVLDILASFNTSFHENGVRISSRREIAKKYLATWIVPDIISSFPIELFALNEFQLNSNGPKAFGIKQREHIRLLLLLKLIRLTKYRKVIFNVQQLFPSHFIYNLTSFFTYLVATTLILHLMTCFFNMNYSDEFLKTPLNYSSFLYDNKDRYLRILLLSTETMTSVGFGEFKFVTISDRIYTICAMSLTSGLLGYVVGGISSALKKSNYVTYYFQDVQRKTAVYCKNNNIDMKLRKKIDIFFRNLKYLHLEKLIKEEDFLDILSNPLKEEVFSYVRGDAILRVNEFTRLSSQTLHNIGYNLKLVMYGPGDLIIKQDQLNDEMYFIVGGTVEVFHQLTRTTFKYLSKTEYFGEIGFFANVTRVASVKSDGFSELFMLKAFDFRKMLATMPKDKEIIETLQRNFKNYGVSVLGVTCYLCKKLGHVSSNCNSYIYKKNTIQAYGIINKIPAFQGRKDYESIFLKEKIFKRMKYQSIKGQESNPYDVFKDNKYLAQEADYYSHWLEVHNRNNSKILSIISFSENHEDQESPKSDESVNSREDFFSFHLPRSPNFTQRFSIDSQCSPRHLL